MLRAVSSCADIAIEDRESLEAFAEALQKVALDRAFSASGVPAKYRTGSIAADLRSARAWLAYARQMGINRAFARHPVNARLFAAEMLATMPSDGKSQ